ncbi:MAG: 50S ribosomal protein L22 [Candidatus Levybacteria bacterium]|nr:50S ribosomal protein L22 [Candidatus Levybacteria bacterium]
MQIIAESNSVTISPRKVRLVADAIRHLTLTEAMQLLSLTPKRASRPMQKVLQSAIANAVNNKRLSQDTLSLKAIEVMEGPVMKRYHPSTRGRIHPYKKQTSHIRVVLESVEKPKEKPAMKHKKGEEEEDE